MQAMHPPPARNADSRSKKNSRGFEKFGPFSFEKVVQAMHLSPISKKFPVS